MYFLEPSAVHELGVIVIAIRPDSIIHHPINLVSIQYIFLGSEYHFFGVLTFSRIHTPHVLLGFEAEKHA